MRKSIHTANQKELQALLRQIRNDAGLCQEALADILEEPQSFISKYERGERRLDVLELRQICAACDVSFVEFITRLEEQIT